MSHERIAILVGALLAAASLSTPLPALAAAPAPEQSAPPPSAGPHGSEQAPPDETRRPTYAIPYTDVAIEDRFWSEAQRVNRRATLPYVWEQCEKTGRIANFRRAAGREEGPYQGLLFDDSDVYKLAEGAAYALHQSQDDFLELRLEDLSKLIAAAQRRDGYINTYYTLAQPDGRWTDLPNGHELYCIGHLIEAGVAQWEGVGKRHLLDVAKRAAAHVRSQFGPGRRTDVAGHPEIELALLRLYRVTGDQADLDLARWFIQQRGRAEGRASAGEHAQDHAPILEQTEVRGHAVRAAYLYAAAAELARLTDDKELTAALERLWSDLEGGKLYITGGIGSSAHNEGFTTAFDLPNDDAYAETCAAIGLVLWAHHMQLLTEDARYADVLERALYNAVRSGVSLSGTRFNYASPLACRGAASGQPHRQPWFKCACCPPNILRILGRLGDFIYARGGDTVYVNLYVKSEAATSFGRAVVSLVQNTDYPWDGRVQLWVQASQPTRFTLALRIPAWAEGATIRLNREKIDPPVERGYALIEREWAHNDIVDLELPMPVRVVQGDQRVRDQQGRFALQRGPLVYCVEEIDSAPDLRSLVFDPGQAFAVEDRPDLLGGVKVVTGSATRPAADGRPEEAVPFVAVPFYAWDNREPGAMTVWLPSTPEAADPPVDPAIRATASHCWKRDSVTALYDGLVPESRSPRFTWWPRKGGAEWVQYDFATPRTLSETELRWFDDVAQGGGCAVPQSWRLLGRPAGAADGSGAWIELAQGELEEGELTTTARFEPRELSAARLEVVLRDGRSGGLLEWSMR